MYAPCLYSLSYFFLYLFFNCFTRKLKETDGISMLVALTREAPREAKDQRPLRSYSNAVITDANRVRSLLKEIIRIQYTNSIFRDVSVFSCFQSSKQPIGFLRITLTSLFFIFGVIIYF